MTALVFPLACFVGLAVANVEVTVAGYTRQPTTLMYCEDGVTIANLASIQWSRALASWGTIDTVQLWNSVTAGGNIGTLPTLVPLAIRQYDIARISAGGIAVINTGFPRPFGIGAFGTGLFARYPGVVAAGIAVVLERAFDNQHACEPGIWAPGPFAAAA